MTSHKKKFNAAMGNYQPRVDAVLEDLQKRNLITRLWARDHTVWNQDPREINDRLGWLDVADAMRNESRSLEAFAEGVRSAGYSHVVLLGMGGSSLGPEVMRQTLGPVPGLPQLLVLDSTIPARIESVLQAIEPARTLFLVSSKSGGTLETLSFYKFFRDLVDKALGKEKAGQNFVAITDEGSSLDSLGRDQGFRRVFHNPVDIGGRYSVLSYFGLVPAVLAGFDLKLLLDRSDAMRWACSPEQAPSSNAGAWLGAVMGAMALEGRDKLTLVTSPALRSFSLWVEQLLAESTGKEGKGIIPIADEPPAAPQSYSRDRLFIYLRLEGDDNAPTDEFLERLHALGHPWVRLDMKDRYDLGGEFYRWEFATAVAGSIIGIHPFDQPNVQEAKDMTDSVLEESIASGKLPLVQASNSLGDLFKEVSPDSYLAIMAYINQTPETDETLNRLRARITERYLIPTTLGYGPRFLHSTGQLHKGGPDTGLFLQIITDHVPDLEIPDENYSFGMLAQAQAIGDLKALQARGRPIVRLHLDSDRKNALASLTLDLN